MIDAQRARNIVSRTPVEDYVKSKVEWEIISAAKRGESKADYYGEIPDEIIEELKNNGFNVDTKEFHGYCWNTITW